MTAKKVFFTTLLVLLVQQQQATEVKKCDSGLLPTVTVECPKGNVCVTPPCKVILGQDIVMNVTFNAPQLLEKIKPQMMATAVGVTIPYPIGDNACDQLLNTACPVAKGELVKYQKSMHLDEIFPLVPVSLQFSIVDEETNNAVVCAGFDIQVVKN